MYLLLVIAMIYVLLDVLLKWSGWSPGISSTILSGVSCYSTTTSDSEELRFNTQNDISLDFDLLKS